MDYALPEVARPTRVKKNQVLLVASGDLRPAANRNCWASQQEMEEKLRHAIAEAGYELLRAHPFRPEAGHGFISSQKEGMAVFAGIDPKAPLIVAEAVWQYSHHVFTAWSRTGADPDRGELVGHLAGPGGHAQPERIAHQSRREVFDAMERRLHRCIFHRRVASWLDKGELRHRTEHVVDWHDVNSPKAEHKLGKSLAAQLLQEKAIMGVFDEGCMGMFNAIIPDELLHPTGVYKERLSQSALYYETTQVATRGDGRPPMDGRSRHEVRHRHQSEDRPDRRADSPQCKMYIAACASPTISVATRSAFNISRG